MSASNSEQAPVRKSKSLIPFLGITTVAILLGILWRLGIINRFFQTTESMQTILNSDETIDSLLDNFALWANENHLTIEINGKSINRNYGAVGGWDFVGWRGQPGQLENTKHISDFRTNLREILKQSNCSPPHVLAAIRALGNWADGTPYLPPTQLTKTLACLGKFMFHPVSFVPY